MIGKAATCVICCFACLTEVNGGRFNGIKKKY